MSTALVIIDMQMVMQDRIDAGRQHVNSDAPQNVIALVGAFRRSGRPVIHVRHEATILRHHYTSTLQGILLCPVLAMPLTKPSL